MLKTIDMRKLIDGPFPTRRELVAEQLETAAKILRGNPDGARDDSACWRIADCGLELRKMLESRGWTGVVGLDEPTGMGAMLPSSQRGFQAENPNVSKREKRK
jgi:hypothetical protein